MSALVTLLEAIFGVVVNWINGIAGIIRVIHILIRVRLKGKEGLGARLAAELTQPKRMRDVMSFLRAFWPNIVLDLSFVKSYENNGTAIVTRRTDITEVLNRNDDFEVVYGPRMREITAGENFFLGMQPGWDYTRDVSAMRLAARAGDVDKIVLPRAQKIANKIVDDANGIIDLPQDLSLIVSSDMVGHYFGTPGPNQATMIDWTTIMFWYLFGDLGADPEVGHKAHSAMAGARSYLDETIARRKAERKKGASPQHVLDRCLDLQSAGVPGMSDLGIRNNIVGLLIGAVPTLSKASCLALQELMSRRNEFGSVQVAAQNDDDDLLARYIWEALRFNPHQPLVYRRSTRDATIARGTARETMIPKGRMVFAMTISGQFDLQAMRDAKQFRVNRPREDYMTWGYGMHNCFGEAINLKVIPAILKPLLKKPGLRYAPGWSGPEMGGTPFPRHMKLTWDR
ncbi:MAG: cytochrome P450 [Pseudomonadota bacterium]